MKTKNNYELSYAEPKFVLDCFCRQTGYPPEKCKVLLAVSVGWNEKEIISSTDWIIKTPDEIFAWSPSCRPRNVSFITLKGCSKITPQGPFEDGLKASVQLPDGRIFLFSSSERLIVPIGPGGVKIPYNNCPVEVTEDSYGRSYVIRPNENTVFAEYRNAKLTIVY